MPGHSCTLSAVELGLGKPEGPPNRSLSRVPVQRLRTTLELPRAGAARNVHRTDPEAPMENLLPPLIILVCVVAIVVVVLRRGARRTRASVETARANGPEAAAEMSARLTEEQHRAIYSLIAQGLTVQAIAAYRQATGAKLIDARNAILLMESHPQAYGEPRETPVAPAEPAPAASSTPSAPLTSSEPAAALPPAGEPEAAPPSSAHEPSKVPAGAPGERSTTRFPYRYRAIVSNGRQTLEVASNLLNDQIYAEIKALAQIGDAEDAALMLWRHSEISIEEARAFVDLL